MWSCGWLRRQDGRQGDELSGKVKENVGDATDNPDLQAEGVGDQAEGKVEQAIGEAKDAFDDVRRRLVDCTGDV